MKPGILLYLDLLVSESYVPKVLCDMLVNGLV